jgi:hypothetical protein
VFPELHEAADLKALEGRIYEIEQQLGAVRAFLLSLDEACGSEEELLESPAILALLSEQIQHMTTLATEAQHALLEASYGMGAELPIEQVR